VPSLLWHVRAPSLMSHRTTSDAAPPRDGLSDSFCQYVGVRAAAEAPRGAQEVRWRAPAKPHAPSAPRRPTHATSCLLVQL
jgi:hypothetical protein